MSTDLNSLISVIVATKIALIACLLLGVIAAVVGGYWWRRRLRRGMGTEVQRVLDSAKSLSTLVCGSIGIAALFAAFFMTHLRATDQQGCQSVSAIAMLSIIFFAVSFCSLSIMLQIQNNYLAKQIVALQQPPFTPEKELADSIPIQS